VAGTGLAIPELNFDVGKTGLNDYRIVSKNFSILPHFAQEARSEGAGDFAAALPSHIFPPASFLPSEQHYE
jgi:hypothetical protein